VELNTGQDDEDELVAKMVPKPSMASACWAEARLARRRIEQAVARRANFLKGNLL